MKLLDSDEIDDRFARLLPRGTRVLLLDTEGLGSYARSETFDVQLFSLSVLLSSLFIYNSTGSIDEAALDKLSLVVELTKHIRIQTDEDVQDARELAAFSPAFLWVVRDFSLKLHMDGHDISARQYLDKALLPIRGDVEQVRTKNLIRSSITAFFQERECKTLVRPVSDEKLLQKLDTLPRKDFRKEFIEQLDDFTTTVFKKTRVKRLFGEAVNGRMLVNLVHNYVDAINAGSVPTIGTAWQNVVQIEGERALKESLKLYKDRMNELFSVWKVMEAEELTVKHEQYLLDAGTLFRKATVAALSGTFEEQFRTGVSTMYAEYRKQNEMDSLTLCTNLINGLVADVQLEDVTDFDELSDVWTELADEKYHLEAKGPAKYKVLCDVLKKRPLEHARRLLERSIAKEAAKAERKIKEAQDQSAVDYERLNVLYGTVDGEWKRSLAMYNDLKEENGSLIQTIARLSLAINDM
ncbi:hypothetical protein, variant [Capsaspora owczarzaki ATCC 30864]|nr:hypothetical protein, variant [Capsaspora owczarzaki ATCC 30864]